MIAGAQVTTGSSEAAAGTSTPDTPAGTKEATPPETTVGTTPEPETTVGTTPETTAGSPGSLGQQQESVTLAAPSNGKKDGDRKHDKVVQSKDTRRELRKEKKIVPKTSEDAKLPDRQLYDKALLAIKKGHFDVARLDLQILLNTYPDSQYQMRSKLAVADSWYKEGGTAALTQAESEYKDFITFFPNAPEAAEAQMRVGDIYFRQMDKPDRDYAKATHAEEEYRLMLQQFPESTLVPQAKQRLREVQEVMATREADIGSFYSTHANWPATIARFQTVADTYPEYSHMDDVLVGLGDAYEAEARFVRSLKLGEAARARLEQVYDGQAAAAYRKVVLYHSASPHVEDARDRLAAMSLPIPAPTPEQVAASVALENSRRQYRLQDRAKLLILHQPDVVMAARVGEPALTDPSRTLAPKITRQIMADFDSAINPGKATAAPDAAKPAAADTSAPETTPESAPAGPLQLQEVPTAGAGDSGGSSVVTTVPGDASRPSTAPGSSMGVEVLTPSATSLAPDQATTSAPSSAASSAPRSATDSATPAATARANDDNGGLKSVGPVDATALPAVERPAGSPDAVNDIAPGSQPVAQAPGKGKKKPKPGFDKGDESSSKHKKKKGLGKINPF